MAEEEEEEETKALNSIPENKKNKEIKFRGRRLCSAHGGLPPLLPPNCMPLIIIQIPGNIHCYFYQATCGSNELSADYGTICYLWIDASEW
ncbi:uncharacterized protein LOC130711106 isoform X9 [Lotus japonicus]|uniref:uncharacterized protein LOC130711106 isoform X9 n=1 Tax=Lotus japonicus TaxID=34305 RepID=UPI002588A967|nr:uncharacterized protein LOC130711106 isoform X9 [Lotus japonicus]